MSEALNKLATAAPLAENAAPAAPWGAIMAAVATGALGFLFGTMRDRSKTKAERTARHREEVLEATAQILTASALLGGLRQDLSYTAWEMRIPRVYRDDMYRNSGGQQVDPLELKREKQLAAINDAESAVQSHLMKVAILAPSLESYARDILFGYQPSGELPSDWRDAGQERLEATRAFKVAVQEHLRITQAKPAKQWRPWIRRPFQWVRKALQKVRGLFLE